MICGYSVLVVEDVPDGGDAGMVTTRKQEDAVPYAVYGTPTAQVHG
ncbi:hypothetical protein [Streptomyces sp. NPDC056661]